MRFEKKFLVETYLINDIKAFLHFNLFSNSFPDRKVTSVYYDDSEFNLLNDSIEGISNRKKIRVRFYNNKFNNAFLENKIKFGELGTKEIKRLSEIDNLNQNLKIELISSNNEKYYLSIPSSIENVYIPQVIVEYKRAYYVNNSDVRVTLDNEIRFSRICKEKGLHKEPIYNPFESSIVEIKYESDQDYHPEIISKLAIQFNLVLTACSKYSFGMQSSA